MSIIINNNPASIAAQRNLGVSTGSLGRSVEHLSSGLRITRAADDAAGLGLSRRCGPTFEALTKPSETPQTASV